MGFFSWIRNKLKINGQYKQKKNDCKLDFDKLNLTNHEEKEFKKLFTVSYDALNLDEKKLVCSILKNIVESLAYFYQLRNHIDLIGSNYAKFREIEEEKKKYLTKYVVGGVKYLARNMGGKGDSIGVINNLGVAGWFKEILKALGVIDEELDRFYQNKQDNRRFEGTRILFSKQFKPLYRNLEHLGKALIHYYDTRNKTLRLIG